MKKEAFHYRVLLVSPEKGLVQAYRKLLKAEHHQVKTAATVDQAAAMLKPGAVDVIVLDAAVCSGKKPHAIEVFREIDKRPRLVLLTRGTRRDWRAMLRQTHIHACFDVDDSDEKFLLCLDATLKNLPKIDLISRQFERIKKQIYTGEKSKEGLRYIISAMPETINRLQPLDKFIKGILTQICGFLHAENSFLATLDEEQRLHLLVGTGLCDVNEKAFLQSKLLKDRSREIARVTKEFRTLVHKHYAIIPLKAKDKILGIFYLEKNQGELESIEEDMLKLFASQAAITIDNSNLFELATTDGLTGLLVRRHFLQRFQEVLQLASRSGGSPVSFLIMDIDHFKQVNDRYGHPVGDVVLRQVAAMLLANTRATDFTGRLGGEEFAMVLSNTAPEQAKVVAENLRTKAKSLAFSAGETTFRISISVGVAGVLSYHLSKSKAENRKVAEIVAEDAKQLLARADQALYQAKESGRDRVVLSKNERMKKEE